MGFVNKVMLMGNLTRDPQTRQLASGTVVCEFGLAMNRVYKTPAGEERQETVFVDCTAFGRTAEIVAEYCPKGRSIFVDGRLHFETWEDAVGARRSKLTVIVENVQFTGSRGSAESGATLYPDMEVSRATAKATTVERKQSSPAFSSGSKDKGPDRRKREPVAAGSATRDKVAVAESPAAAAPQDDIAIPF